MCDTSDNRNETQTVIAKNTLLARKQIHENTRLGRPRSKSRRMKLLERMGYFGSLPPNVRISRAITLEDICGAYQMVYDNFLKMGYILKNESGMRVRLFEAVPETATFIAKVNGKIIGVTSAIIDSPDLGVPADKTFRQEIDELRRNGGKICEGTNWVIDPEYRRTNVMPELMRTCFAHSLMAGCNAMLATISPGHQSYYKIICFDTVGSERSSSPEIDDPVILQLNSYDKFFARWEAVQPDEQSDDAVVTNFFIGDNPYYEKVKQWASVAEPAFLDTILLRRLFAGHGNFLNECNEEEREKLRHRWGDGLFREVQENPTTKKRRAS